VRRMKLKVSLDKLKKLMPMSVKGWMIYFGTMGAASVAAMLLQNISDTDTHVPLIFVLVVLIISLTTDGYFYGILAALTSVITVNYAFTYPYAKLDFTIYGYPLTFVIMLAVSVAVCTLTTRVRAQEKYLAESELEKVRANLLRAVSHDLRTPLTSISGSISAVLEDSGEMDERQRRELLGDAREDAEWLCRMVENLLSVTKMSGGEKTKLNKEEEILEEVLSEAVMNFRKKHSDLEIAVSVPSEMLFVPMDAMLIEQVLINLMDNAHSHGMSTSKIRISAEECGDTVRISVSDNGRGLDEASLEHIFDNGFRVEDRNDPDKARGFGIGLSVCRTIIQAHGGEIFAGNNAEGGAVFAFTLPYGGKTV